MDEGDGDGICHLNNAKCGKHIKRTYSQLCSRALPLFFPHIFLLVSISFSHSSNCLHYATTFTSYPPHGMHCSQQVVVAWIHSNKRPSFFYDFFFYFIFNFKIFFLFALRLPNVVHGNGRLSAPSLSLLFQINSTFFIL